MGYIERCSTYYSPQKGTTSPILRILVCFISLARQELEVLLVQLGGVRPIKDLRDGEFWGFFEDSLKGSARPPLRDL